MATSPEDDARRVAAITDAVAVVDRLRSPGGCPWYAEQTHASLARYAIEEGYEVAQAAEGDDPAALRDELGDLLLQVVLHARLAAEGDTFDLSDVATGLAAKLRRRNPHVFAADGSKDLDVAQVHQQYLALKQKERSAEPRSAQTTSTESVLAGIPDALPALMSAQQTLARAQGAGIAVGPDPEADPFDPIADIGAELLAVVARAQAIGVDAESALRAQVRSLRGQVRADEAVGPSAM